MSMILAAAATALAALYAYNRSQQRDPVHTTEKVNDIRQGLEVILAVAEAAWAIMDALAGARSSVKARPAKARPTPPSFDEGATIKRTWGTTLASDLA